MFLLSVSALLPPFRPSRVTRENFDLISGGMTRAQVEAILGPPGDYRTGRTSGFSCMDSEDFLHLFDGAQGQVVERTEWIGDTAFMSVAYGKAGTTSSAFRWDLIKEEQSPLDNLLWRAKRLWQPARVAMIGKAARTGKLLKSSPSDGLCDRLSPNAVRVHPGSKIVARDPSRG